MEYVNKDEQVQYKGINSKSGLHKTQAVLRLDVLVLFYSITHSVLLSSPTCLL